MFGQVRMTRVTSLALFSIALPSADIVYKVSGQKIELPSPRYNLLLERFGSGALTGTQRTSAGVHTTL